MKLADLDVNTLEAILAVQWNRIIKKHEGPED